MVSYSCLPTSTIVAMKIMLLMMAMAIYQVISYLDRVLDSFSGILLDVGDDWNGDNLEVSDGG